MTGIERAALATSVGVGVGWAAGVLWFLYWLNHLDGEWEFAL